jgi:hypothetical protein
MQAYSHFREIIQFVSAVYTDIGDTSIFDCSKNAIRALA